MAPHPITTNIIKRKSLARGLLKIPLKRQYILSSYLSSQVLLVSRCA
jgi:hypothetical protein